MENQYGCFGSDTIVISITTDLGSLYNDIYIKAYPNPSKGIVNIEWSSDSKIRSYEVYDSFGRLVQSRSLKPSSVQSQVNLKSLVKGSYFIRLFGDGFTQILTIVLD